MVMTGHWVVTCGQAVGVLGVMVTPQVVPGTTGHWVVIAGHWVATFGHWVVVAGHWVVTSGHWVADCGK